MKEILVDFVAILFLVFILELAYITYKFKKLDS
jgi:hypothetical protein